MKVCIECAKEKSELEFGSLEWKRIGGGRCDACCSDFVVGQRVHKLTLTHLFRDGHGALTWTVDCDCGTRGHCTTEDRLRRNTIRSCGCHARLKRAQLCYAFERDCKRHGVNIETHVEFLARRALEVRKAVKT